MYSAVSPAKLNIFLHIIGKKSNGYHLLESLFTKIKLADNVTVSQATGVQCATYDVHYNPIVFANNIALSAAALLKTEYKVSCGVDIIIEKQIPIGAGLGGASSNAATTLLLLNQLWNLNLSLAELQAHAVALGADVPFFLEPEKTAMVFGIGEVVKPVSLNLELPILLVYPNLEISTKEVYQKSVTVFTDSFLQQPKDMYNIDVIQWVKQLIYQGHNDLYHPAFALHPSLEKVLEALQKQVGCMVARMSGSGSACFGIFERVEEAQLALEYLHKMHPDWFLYYESVRL